MAGLIPQSFIDDLLNRSDIVEVVGSRMFDSSLRTRLANLKTAMKGVG